MGKQKNDVALIKRSGKFELLHSTKWEPRDLKNAKCPQCMQFVDLHMKSNRHFEHRRTGDKKACSNRIKSKITGPIIKLENVAEALVAIFFEHFLNSDENSFPALCVKDNSLKLMDKKQIAKILGEKIKVEAQFPINNHFDVAKVHSKERTLIINPISCFDCSLVGNGIVLPIEVKSGRSGKYSTIEKNLRNSLDKNPVLLTDSLEDEFLKGDMISILSNRVLEGSKLKFLKDPLLDPKKDSKLKLHNEWILIVQNNKQIKGFKGIEEDIGLKYILSLQDIIEYLKDQKQLQTFEKTLLKDFHQVIKIA